MYSLGLIYHTRLEGTKYSLYIFEKNLYLPLHRAERCKKPPKWLIRLPDELDVRITDLSRINNYKIVLKYQFRISLPQSMALIAPIDKKGPKAIDCLRFFLFAIIINRATIPPATIASTMATNTRG